MSGGNFVAVGVSGGSCASVPAMDVSESSFAGSSLVYKVHSKI